MSIAYRRFAPAFLAGAAALAIIAAPAASAANDTHLSCAYQSTGNSVCESPGNVQLTATPQYVPYEQQYPYLYGGPIFIHHFGGGHGMGGHR